MMAGHDNHLDCGQVCCGTRWLKLLLRTHMGRSSLSSLHTSLQVLRVMLLSILHN